MPGTDGFPFYIFLGVIGLLLLRFFRVVYTCTPSGPEPPPAAPPGSPASWWRSRTITKIASCTALARARAELFHCKIDEVQAQHDLDRLVAELQPPVAADPPHQPPAVANNPVALTLPEIQQLVGVLDLDEDTRTDLLRLVTARLAEKRS